MLVCVYVCALILLVGDLCCALPSLHKSKSSLDRQSKWEDFFLIDPTLNEEEFHLDEIWDKSDGLNSQIWSNCGKLHVLSLDPSASSSLYSHCVKTSKPLHLQIACQLYMCKCLEVSVCTLFTAPATFVRLENSQKSTLTIKDAIIILHFTTVAINVWIPMKLKCNYSISCIYHHYLFLRQVI